MMISAPAATARVATAAFEVAHGRRQDDAPVVVRQAFRHAVPHGRDQRMGGAQIDADGNAPLVRVRRLARF